MFSFNFTAFSYVERTVGKTTIRVDEVSSNSLPVLFENKEEKWSFPATTIAEKLVGIKTDAFSKLPILLIHLHLDTGGGDELSMKVYIEVKASDGKVFEHNFPFFSVYDYEQSKLRDEGYILGCVVRCITTVQYMFKVYQTTGIILDGKGHISDETIRELKAIGLKKVLSEYRSNPKM